MVRVSETARASWYVVSFRTHRKGLVGLEPWTVCAKAFTPSLKRIMRDPHLEVRISYYRAYDLLRDEWLHRFDFHCVGRRRG